MPFMATASVDRISNINVWSNGVLREMFPTVDTVDEVRVSSTSNNAEFAQAGDIAVTSKSGTNLLHGGGYWHHQNGAFDARDFFASRTPFKVSNDYGGTLFTFGPGGQSFDGPGLLRTGWQISGILLVQSGPFLTPVTGNVADPGGTAVSSRANSRPDWTGSSYGNLAGSARTVNAWWDRAAFTIPGHGADGRPLPNNGAVGRFGNAAPGGLIGPGTPALSMKLQKRLAITERFFAQLEGSAANLTNAPNFGFPNRNVSVQQFGRVTSTQGEERARSGSLQIGSRIGF
jgi:hypothetical protein